MQEQTIINYFRRIEKLEKESNQQKEVVQQILNSLHERISALETVVVATNRMNNVDKDKLSETIELIRKEAKESEEKIKDIQDKVELVDREVQVGDIVHLDFIGKLDSIQFQGGTAFDYRLKTNNNEFLPDFEKQIIGMKAGEEKIIKVFFPLNYGAELLRGKEVEFAVKILKVKAPKAIISA